MMMMMMMTMMMMMMIIIIIIIITFFTSIIIIICKVKKRSACGSRSQQIVIFTMYSCHSMQRAYIICLMLQDESLGAALFVIEIFHCPCGSLSDTKACLTTDFIYKKQRRAATFFFGKNMPTKIFKLEVWKKNNYLPI